MSSLVGSSRRCHVGRPNRPASSSSTKRTSPGRYRSRRLAYERAGSENLRLRGRRLAGTAPLVTMALMMDYAVDAANPSP